MIVLIRCNDIVSDSRAKKYLAFYQEKGIDYKVIAWNRLGTGTPLPHTVYCPVRSKYNQGGLAAVIDRIKWMYFILKTLFSFNEDLRIHACDLDAAFPAVVYKMLSRRRNYVLFDIFDWISDTLYNQGRVVSLAFKFMERLSVKKSDHMIICEEERISQVPYDMSGRYSVLQNIPSFKTSVFLRKKEEYGFANGKITLSYVGSFTLDRCLEPLIEGARQGHYNLLIAGYGHDRILQMLDEYMKCPYIKYLGKVAYEDALNIMYNSDLIYAMYSKMNPNHLYAAPNKFYEAMFVGKALITTRGIIVANKVQANDMGYAIDETVEALVELVDSISTDNIRVKSANASRLWSRYESATRMYLESTYSEIFLSLQNEKH